jgi:hypothetical protein
MTDNPVQRWHAHNPAATPTHADLDVINGEKIEALEAKLAKAVEALRLYACKNECNDGRCHCSGNDCGQHASDTLAEIEAEKT